MWWDNLPQKLEDQLRSAGAIMNEAFPMISRVTECNKLITGQGPTSADAFAEKFVNALNEARGRVAQA